MFTSDQNMKWKGRYIIVNAGHQSINVCFMRILFKKIEMKNKQL